MITLQEIFNKIGFQEITDSTGLYVEYHLELGKTLIAKREFESGLSNFYLIETTSNYLSGGLVRVGMVKFNREYDPFCEFDFWSIVLSPDFCKKVFGESARQINKNSDAFALVRCSAMSSWQECQVHLLLMRNNNKSIDEVLQYISENTILDFS